MSKEETEQLNFLKRLVGNLSEDDDLKEKINAIAEVCNMTSTMKGFTWNLLIRQTKKIRPYAIASLLALIHSEVSECLEALRDDNLEGATEELADIVIRVLDLSVALKVNLVDTIFRKMQKNLDRPKKHGRKNF